VAEQLQQSMTKILLVDDDEAHRLMLKAILKDEGYQVFEVDDGLKAVEAVKGEFYDLILMDVRMTEMSGIEALQEIKKIRPGIPVLIMTAYGSIKSAVEAMKLGAYDYLTKPLDTDELRLTIARILDHHRLQAENLQLRERLANRFDFSQIVGKSKKMQDLFEMIALVAPSDATVLISGESGTGKELIANAIHQNSPRKDKPFIKVNCAALPETLLESELFGHEKGAFTGAIHRTKGRFELANGGTLFLDEVAEMSPATQVKLLRVLQEQAFEPLGGGKTLQVEVRILAATNKNLEEEVHKGRFRKDLFYRLHVVPVYVPPLRERKEDIPLLAGYFLSRYREKNNRDIKGFTPRAIDLLVRYDWPGNVRELENAVERGVILCRGDYLTPEELPLALQALDKMSTEEGPEVTASCSVSEMEKRLILKTLEQTGGNRTRAAELLGISRRTLQYKLKEYGIH